MLANTWRDSHMSQCLRPQLRRAPSRHAIRATSDLQLEPLSGLIEQDDLHAALDTLPRTPTRPVPLPASESSRARSREACSSARSSAVSSSSITRTSTSAPAGRSDGSSRTNGLSSPGSYYCVDRRRRDREGAGPRTRYLDLRDAVDPRCLLHRHPPCRQARRPHSDYRHSGAGDRAVTASWCAHHHPAASAAPPRRRSRRSAAASCRPSSGRRSAAGRPRRTRGARDSTARP